jgi:hypothetical protein
MRLAAIYNVWDGDELLEGSIKQIYDYVDLIIIVWQDVSNYGEHYAPKFSEFLSKSEKTIFHYYYPKRKNGYENEIQKRQIGLEIAKQQNCTHFLHLDCDEYYEDFKEAKEEYIKRGTKGSVCGIYTYFKNPTYRLETPDGYYVPFIHELKPGTQVGVRKYPFYVDPTRKINEKDVIKLEIYMHHFSWVRKDIQRKARNSSAKINLERGTLLKDYYCNTLCSNPSGFYLKDFDKKIILVPNRFNIEEV